MMTCSTPGPNRGRTRHIEETACGPQSSGTLEEHEERYVAARLAEWVLEGTQDSRQRQRPRRSPGVRDCHDHRRGDRVRDRRGTEAMAREGQRIADSGLRDAAEVLQPAKLSFPLRGPAGRNWRRRQDSIGHPPRNLRCWGLTMTEFTLRLSNPITQQVHFRCPFLLDGRGPSSFEGPYVALARPGRSGKKISTSSASPCLSLLPTERLRAAAEDQTGRSAPSRSRFRSQIQDRGWRYRVNWPASWAFSLATNGRSTSTELDHPRGLQGHSLCQLRRDESCS